MNSLWTGLTRLPIRLKIALIGLAGILGMLAISFAAQHGETMRAQTAAEIQHTTQIEQALLTTSVQIHRLRTLEMEWLLNFDPAAANAHAALVTSIADTLAGLKEATAVRKYNTASLAEPVRLISDSLKNYTSIFAALHQARQKMGTQDNGADQIHGTLMMQQKQSQDLYQPLAAQVDSAIAQVRQLNAATEAEYEKKMAAVSGLIKYISMLAVGVLGFFATFAGFRIGTALRAMDKAIRKLAHGSFDIDLPNRGRRDEIGRMADGIDSFRAKLMEKTRHDAEREIALKMEVDFERRSAAYELADQFEATVSTIIDEVSRLSQELQTAAGSLADTARNSENASNHVSQASEEMATTAMSVAQASDEMSSSIASISHRLGESNRIAQEAVVQIAQINERMENLAAATEKIDDIVNLISGIAKKTNLLALNATIEAARAGEAGRGFAVVATEVKALANQTAQATGGINNQIAAMLNASRDSIEAIAGIGQTVTVISQLASEIATAITQQSSATHEIARNTQLSAQNTNEITQRIYEISTGAGETGSAANQVLMSAKMLSGESLHLRKAVNEFLSGVRAA